MPLLYGLFCVGLYGQKKITKIPVSIIDQDHSSLSRQITAALFASEAFRKGPIIDSPEQFPALAAENKSYGCIVFPQHFERDALAGKPVKVAVWVDASNIAIANVAMTAAVDVVGRFNAGVDLKRSLMRGSASASQGSSEVMPIRDEYRILYSPALNANYANFLLIGFVCVAIQLLAALLGAESISLEVEKNTLSELKSSSSGPASVIIGKVFVYAVIMLPMSLVAMILPFPLAQLPFRGDPLIIALVTFWFILIVSTAAVGMSAACKNSIQSIQFLAIIVMPSYLLSGFTWPSLGMVKATQILAVAEPLSHYLTIVRRVTLMGDGVRDITQPLSMLVLWSIAAWCFAYFPVRKLLTKQQEAAQ
jgi:ABC-2 type transport system permease protein